MRREQLRHGAAHVLPDPAGALSTETRRPSAGTPSGARVRACALPLLLVGIVAADRARNDRQAAVVRVFSLALVAVLVAEAAGFTARLIVDLVEGGPETNSATDLLSVGFAVWLYTILAFAFG
jgi:hypothetical protein